MKLFYEQSGIGRAKYVVNYHDGVKKHSDGSDFYYIATFRNKQHKAKFIESLREHGYSYKRE